LHAPVQKAATAAGVHIAPWLRHMVHRITIADFPASWQEGQSGERPHDSRTYTEPFMLRVDESARIKLQDLVEHFGVSKAEIVRQLLIQAKPEDFPKSWHMRTVERRAQHARQSGTQTPEMHKS
jgi:hypothetical protein